MPSGINAKGDFGKQDFVYVAEDDFYLCPAGNPERPKLALTRLLGAGVGWRVYENADLDYGRPRRVDRRDRRSILVSAARGRCSDRAPVVPRDGRQGAFLGI